MNKRWIEPIPVTVPDALREAVGGHQIIAEELVRRGIQSPEEAQRFLNPEAYIPAPPDDLPDMDKAVSRLQQALDTKERILIWGDFDVDGQTATSLLYSALRDLGANVDYHIPNRFTEGHGIHIPTLTRLLDQGFDMVLTCDTGIAAHEAIAYAHSRKVDVVVTDHHALPDTLPDAYACVNPMQLPERHALRELPGVGVAYKTIQALYGDQSTEHLLDLVALGIVADVMVQVDDTRYLLQRGLAVMRQNRRLGLRAMLEVAEIKPEDLNEGHIGFQLAPRLNALGRLDDANASVELLTTDDYAQATLIATRLEGMNAQRKLLVSQVYEGAVGMVESDESLLDYAILVLAGENWHTGVVGIVASRLVEQYNRPVLLLSIHEDGQASGSARSVQGCDITEAIKTQAHLLNRYGGHTMAAGLGCPVDNIHELRIGLSRVVRGMLKEVDKQPTLSIDAFVSLADVSTDLADDIARLAPFGNGNPPLTLASRHLKIRSKTTLGRRAEHLKMTVEDDAGNKQEVIWWRGGDEQLPEGYFDLAYTLRISDYRGERKAQMEWLDARIHKADMRQYYRDSAAYEVVDKRNEPRPEHYLQTLLQQEADTLVWREGDATLDGVSRLGLGRSNTLVVWTIPPGPDEWQGALEAVVPYQLVLIGAHRGPIDIEAFLRRLAGLVKYAVRARDGVVELAELAAAMAHREKTVEIALRWLASRGQISFKEAIGSTWMLSIGGEAQGDDDRLMRQFQTHLNETRAYHDFWMKAAHKQ